MAKLRPSDILKNIRARYATPEHHEFRLLPEHADQVGALVGQLDLIDDRELDRVSENERSSFLTAREAMRAMFEATKSLSMRERIDARGPKLVRMPELANQHPIQVVRDILEKIVVATEAYPAIPPSPKPSKPSPHGRWKIDRDLKPGGQGEVFVVRDQTGEHKGLFVLKRLRNIARKGRFQREVAACLALDHPHIIRIVDSDLDATRPYLVTAYRRHGHLTFTDLHALGLPERLALFTQIVDAFAYAHSNAIVHRDVKPDNILVRDDDSLEVADFGLCYIQDECDEADRQTETMEVHRNWLCTAPELEGGRVEVPAPASDVYCLGKLLYWMLTGRALPRESHRLGSYDLTGTEPRPGHALVYELLDRMIVAEAGMRLQNGAAVKAALDTLARRVRANAHVMDLSAPQHCTYCGLGTYKIECDPRLWEAKDDRERQLNISRAGEILKGFGLQAAYGVPWLVLRCDNCGHLQMFHPNGPVWGPPTKR
jgi:hypothetical protein